MSATTTTETIHLGQIVVRFLLDGTASDGPASVFEFDVPAGARVPAAHSHDAYEETIYGLRGVLTWTLDGETVEVGEGEAICIPRGVVHRFENHGETDATGVAVVTPGLLGAAYFREVGTVAAAAAGGPPDLEALKAVMRAHGLTPAA